MRDVRRAEVAGGLAAAPGMAAPGRSPLSWDAQRM